MTYVLWCFIKTERKRANLLFHSEVVDKLYLSNKRWFTWWPYLDNSGVSEWNIRKFRMLYFSSFNINVFYSVGSGFVAPYFLKTTSFPLHWLSFLKNLASSSFLSYFSFTGLMIVLHLMCQLTWYLLCNRLRIVKQ